MSFSNIYQFLIQKRKVHYRNVFFQRLAHHLNNQTATESQLWMRDYLQAIHHHCQENDIFYYVSTKSVNDFLKSLKIILTYSYVDDLCLDLCYRHVCHLCPCKDNYETCLQPHF